MWFGILLFVFCVGFGVAVEFVKVCMVEDVVYVECLWVLVMVCFDFEWKINGVADVCWYGNFNICCDGLDVVWLIFGLCDIVFFVGLVCVSGLGWFSYVLKVVGLMDVEV